MTLHTCLLLVALPAADPAAEARIMSNRSATALLSIVMPLSCSSSRESRNRSLPAMRCEMMLLDDSRESAKDVLPWST